MSVERHTLLVSAEGCAERDVPWMREATEEEIAAVEEANPGIVFEKLLLDETGRPYSWRTVLASHPDCPKAVAEKASTMLRVMRFS